MAFSEFGGNSTQDEKYGSTGHSFYDKDFKQEDSNDEIRLSKNEQEIADSLESASLDDLPETAPEDVVLDY